MEIPLKQFDNFAPDAEKVRNAVIRAPFKTETGPDGAEYTGISEYPVPHWPGLIEKHIGMSIVPKLSCFRLNLAGELPHSWVHSDDICAQYASVLYLNKPEQCKGGTAFWKHRGLNLNRLPDRQELEKGGILPEWFYSMMEREWKDKTYWEQEQMVPMKWNRFITYPTCFFHSRYPFESFGKDATDGRLIWICFYDLGVNN